MIRKNMIKIDNIKSKFKNIRSKFKSIKSKFKNITDIIAIFISIVALISSYSTTNKTNEITKEFNTIQTYSEPLSYVVEISSKYCDGCMIIGGKKIKAKSINVVPNYGGIDKIYGIYYHKDNVMAIISLDFIKKDINEKYKAYNLAYTLPEYTLQILAESDTKLFSTLYLVVKDYQNNIYTNMIVFEIDKEDYSKVETRQYSEIDTLHLYNNDIENLPEFDFSALKDYQSLLKKLSIMK